MKSIPAKPAPSMTSFMACGLHRTARTMPNTERHSVLVRPESFVLSASNGSVLTFAHRLGDTIPYA